MLFSKLTRFLSSQTIKRCVAVEAAASDALINGKDIVTVGGRSIKLELVMEWFSGVTLMVVQELKYMYNMISEIGAEEDVFRSLVGHIEYRCGEYDSRLFGFDLRAEI